MKKKITSVMIRKEANAKKIKHKNRERKTTEVISKHIDKEYIKKREI